MAKYKIATIPGDGIGPEVMDVTVAVLEAYQEKVDINFEFTKLMAGDEHKAKTGVALPPETLDEVRKADAALFAAVGETAKEVILPLRQKLDLYVNLRPTRVFPRVNSLKKDVDIVIVRENTEGLYKMIGDRGPDYGFNIRIITRSASERIARYAFEYARKEGRKKVTCVHKANVLDKTCTIFQEACRSVAESYSDIEYDEHIVDACAMRLILNPEWFDVIVTTNMFGDILSDEAAGLVGGLGLAPSGNIGDKYSIFEPVHGSAPDIAGRGIANPIATVLSGSLMLKWLGEHEAAQAIESAVMDVLVEGKTLTPDMGGSSTTKQLGQAIIKKL
jgi:3-isopropylmalate dehydrogenase